MENVTCEESETFVDDNTTVKTWLAKNTTGIVVAKWEGTFTRIEEAPVEEYEQIGILVIGHGSPSDSWCAPLRSVVANVSSPYPVELGFLEFVPNETINIAVDKLDEAGVTKIIAVPLFISSHSGHIGEIEYVLGLREELPEMNMMSRPVFVEGKEMERSIVSLEGRYRVSYMPIAETVSAMGVTAKQHHGGGEAEEEELVPVDTETEIVLTNAIDDHWAIADILVDHATMLIEDPANETIVLIAHGTGNESNFAGWVSSSESLAEQVKLKLRYGMGLNINDVRYSFVFPNETLHSDHVSMTSDPIVVPLMVSEGYFTGRKIPGLLENISYEYPEKGARALTPHLEVAEWIELTAAKELSYPSVQIYDGEELLTITIEDAGKYHGEGVVEICPCVASAFRSTLQAFSDEELWNGTPHRGDVKIIGAHPSDGHVMTFEYILNSTEDRTIDEGADIVNITADNYVYTFTRKSTNDSVTIRVKEEIFPERFFELRT
jgi:sirohydrochlorin ferrochelatase